MNREIPPGGRVSGPRLAVMLGNWRRSGSRHGATDLASAIELQVLDGQLPLGTRLPAERELAEALGASRTMVGGALEKLRTDGVVASRRGSGSWITAPRRAPLGEEPEAAGLLDFARAAPPAIGGLIQAVDSARHLLAAELPEHGYFDQGLPLLRERIAARFTARGLPTTPDEVMITNGAHHAFVLCLRMLAGPGDRVLVEQPTYPNALEAIRGSYATPVPVALTEEGWDIPGVEAVLRQAAPRLAYLIADFQNPTGFRLDAEGRARLGALFSRARTPVVIDETMVELDLEGDPLDGPPPFAAFAPDWTVTIGSAAKSHWGGLRIGWIRANGELLGRLRSARFAVDLGSPVLEQLVFAEMLADPEPRLRERRQELKARRDALAGALHWFCPEWTFDLPAGGLALWCRLPEPMSTRLAVAAANHGLQIAPGSRFGAHGGLERRLRLPFALPSDKIHDAVRRLSLAAASVRPTAEATVDYPVA